MKVGILFLLISYVTTIDLKSRLLRKMLESEIETYIFGGRDAMEGEAPWTVAIQIIDRPTFLCGGAIVGPQWVVTAAFCSTGNYSKY